MRIPWNKGLTKETSPIVALTGLKGSATRTGRTKETHPNLSRALTARGADRSPTQLAGDAAGAAKRKGRTKDTDPGLASMSAKLKGRTKETDPSISRRAEKLRLMARTEAQIAGARKMAENRRGKERTPAQLDGDRKVAAWMLTCRGDKAASWIDGRSFLPYAKEFNRLLKARINMRDNYTCQRCGISQDECLSSQHRKLDTHHIDYNKHNTDDSNLISLCRKCNATVNANRCIWERYFKHILYLDHFVDTMSQSDFKEITDLARRMK
jgi:hypothetical protein